MIRPRFTAVPGRRPVFRTAMAAVAAPGAITLLAALPARLSTTGAALLYVLAVMAAAVIGGVWAGLGASALSFLALNFFFTPPFHTLTVGKVEDLVALLVFLVVSATVGALLSNALGQRARAEGREREARLIHNLSSRLLAGEPTEDVLGRMARGMEELFGLARCEIDTEAPANEDTGRRPASADESGASEEIPMVARGGQGQGTIRVVTGGSRPPLADHERDLMRTLAGQIALALDGVRMAKEAEAARVDADASRARAALFSSISHDLRTPLASITAAVTSLQGEDADFDATDRGELLETIRQEAVRLNRLVGNLLHLSRMRAGGLVPSKAPAALDELIEGVVGRLEPVLGGHRIRLLLREDLPDVPMDVIQIDQVLTNLLENAAKFSPPGSEIAVHAARWQDMVRVRVTDRGPGIAPEDRRRVFEPFFRAEGDTGPGTGLGLAIARAIVEAHGGRIWIEAAPAGGTAVLFDIPITAKQ